MSKRCLLSLLAFILNVWVNENERLVSISVLSQRATKRTSHSFSDTETELEGRGNWAMTLASERCRRRQVLSVRELEWLGAGGMKSECTTAGPRLRAREREWCDSADESL